MEICSKQNHSNVMTINIEEHNNDIDSQDNISYAMKFLSSWKNVKVKGIIFLLLFVLLSNFVNVLVKELTGTIHPLNLLLFRSVTMFSLTLPWSLAVNKPAFPSSLTKGERGLLMFRGLVGFLNIIASYYSLSYLNIGDQKMVVSTRPVFVIIFARTFLKEACGLFEVVIIIMMMTGIVFVIKPPFMFGTDFEGIYDQASMMAALAVFATTALSANTTIILRKLRKQHTVSLTVANQMLFTIQSFAVIMVGGFELSNPEGSTRLIILGMSLVVIAYSCLNILALKVVEANISAVVTNSSDLIVALMVQIVYYNHIPDMYSILGASFVFIALILYSCKKIFPVCEADSSKENSPSLFVHLVLEKFKALPFPKKDVSIPCDNTDEK